MLYVFQKKEWMVLHIDEEFLFSKQAAIEYINGDFDAAKEALIDMPPRVEEELDSVSLRFQSITNQLDLVTMQYVAQCLYLCIYQRYNALHFEI